MKVMRWVALSGWALLAFAQLSFSSDRTWIGGSSSNWFDPANWDPPGVPVATESVTVTNLTTIVLTDNVVLASLELRRAALVVSNQLTVTNLVVSDGARLNAWQVRPTPITHPPPGFGIVEVPSGGQMRIVESLTSSGFTMEGTRLNLRGSGIFTNSSTLLPFYLSELNVYGNLQVGADFSFDGANGPPSGSVNVYGTLQSSGTNVNFVTTFLTNRGTILVQAGTMNISSGANAGLMNISFNATQSFAGNFEHQRGGAFQGFGTVRLTRGTFDCGTNDLLIQNLHLASPGMTVLGTNTIRAVDTVWELGDFSGAGDVIATSHITIAANPPGARGKTVHGTRRFVNRGKGTFGTNATVTFLDRSSCRNEIVLSLLPGAGIFGFAAAAPHPDVSVVNLGTLACSANGTNSIMIRMTNSGTVQVNGQLRLQDRNSVQIAGSTVVAGSLWAANGYRIDAGTLSGTGAIQGVLRNSGTISPGPGSGPLSVQGSVTNNGRLAIDLGFDGATASSDLLSVSNHLRMGGSMAITYAGNTWPPEGTLWEVLRFGSASGAFGRVEGLDLGGGRVLQPAFSATNLVLVLSNQPPQKFFLSTVQPQPGQLELRYTGDFDTFYSLEASSNLTSWISILQTNRPDGVIYFREGTTFPWRFYRMRALP